jgi:hypothetical protein
VALANLTTDTRDGVTVVTARDGLFDAMPESGESAPLAAAVVAEFRSAIAGAAAVVLDLRRAGEVNKQTLNVAFRMAHALRADGVRGVLCGPAHLKEIGDLCRGGTACQLYEDIAEACAAVGRA